MKLIFKNSRDEERVIAELSSIEECDIEKCNREINKFLDDSYHKSCYIKIRKENGLLILDVGSASFLLGEGFVCEGFICENITFGGELLKVAKII